MRPAWLPAAVVVPGVAVGGADREPARLRAAPRGQASTDQPDAVAVAERQSQVPIVSPKADAAERLSAFLPLVLPAWPEPAGQVESQPRAVARERQVLQPEAAEQRLQPLGPERQPVEPGGAPPQWLLAQPAPLAPAQQPFPARSEQAGASKAGGLPVGA